jgi:hypothetical protein
VKDQTIDIMQRPAPPYLLYISPPYSRPSSHLRVRGRILAHCENPLA